MVNAAVLMIPVLSSYAAAAQNRNTKPLEKGICPCIENCPGLRFAGIEYSKDVLGCALIAYKHLDNYHDCNIAMELESGKTPEEIYEEIRNFKGKRK